MVTQARPYVIDDARSEVIDASLKSSGCSTTLLVANATGCTAFAPGGGFASSAESGSGAPPLEQPARNMNKNSAMKKRISSPQRSHAQLMGVLKRMIAPGTRLAAPLGARAFSVSIESKRGSRSLIFNAFS